MFYNKLAIEINSDRLYFEYIDPLFLLKGAARPAQEFYKQPGLMNEPMPKDIIQEYHGRLFEHAEGKKLLEAMLSLGVHLHNDGNKTKQAIQILSEVFEYDPSDHLVCKNFIHIINYSKHIDITILNNFLITFYNNVFFFYFFYLY